MVSGLRPCSKVTHSPCTTGQGPLSSVSKGVRVGAEPGACPPSYSLPVTLRTHIPTPRYCTHVLLNVHPHPTWHTCTMHTYYTRTLTHTTHKPHTHCVHTHTHYTHPSHTLNDYNHQPRPPHSAHTHTYHTTHTLHDTGVVPPVNAGRRLTREQLGRVKHSLQSWGCFGHSDPYEDSRLLDLKELPVSISHQNYRDLCLPPREWQGQGDEMPLPRRSRSPHR